MADGRVTPCVWTEHQFRTQETHVRLTRMAERRRLRMERVVRESQMACARWPPVVAPPATIFRGDECPVCCDASTSEDLVLVCGHVICFECHDRLAAIERPCRCPQCRRPSPYAWRISDLERCGTTLLMIPRSG